MRLCCNCFEELLDREIICPICNSNITLDNNQTKEFYSLVNYVRTANKFKQNFLKKNPKYKLVFQYINYKEQNPRNNNYNRPKILHLSLHKNTNESEEEFWNRINQHTINKIESTRPIIKCPYCHSTNTKKITNTSKAVHTALFGVFSISRNSKQFHCNNCNSDF